MRVQGRAALWVVLAGAACASHAPRPAARAPRIAPAAASSPARPIELPIARSVLVARPPMLEPYDVEDMRAMLEGAELPAPTFPRRPYVPALTRPASGGEALELADLALARGDALDAAAQYRALLPRLDPEAAVYANLRLARAYALLHDRARAEQILYGIAGTSSPLAWVALVDLADLRTEEVGARAALHELSVIAGARTELLADYLIDVATDHVAAELLVEKADRLGRCDLAQAAVERDPELRDEAVPPRCRARIEEARLVIAGRTFGAQYLAFFEARNRFVDRWDALARAALDGTDDPAPWVAFAEDATGLRELAMNAERVEETDVVIRSALVVAIELAPARVRDDAALTARIRAAASRLGPRHARVVVDRLTADRAMR